MQDFTHMYVRRAEKKLVFIPTHNLIVDTHPHINLERLNNKKAERLFII